MLILIGKSTSGKNTVRDILVEKYGFKSIVTYTTRPMRKGEIQDVTYHYISEEDFLKKINNSFFIEWKKYDVQGNTWYYGTAKEDILNSKDNDVIILTPKGVEDLKITSINEKQTFCVIYLYANLETIRKRLQMRKDANDKIEDRIKRDNRDFKNADFIADRIVYNNFDENINEVVDKILKYYEQKQEQNKGMGL